MRIASRHSFPLRLAVWVVPATVTNRPLWSWRARPSAQAKGVAGSPVVPTTTIGGAPGADQPAATTAADPEPTTFRFLDQDHADQREREQGVNDEKEGEHRAGPVEKVPRR